MITRKQRERKTAVERCPRIVKDWRKVCSALGSHLSFPLEVLHPRGTVKHVQLQILPSCQQKPSVQLSAVQQIPMACLPPPTRTITFFVAVLGSPLAPARLSVVNLHVTVFFAKEFENAY